MSKVELTQLIETGAHFGHLTRRWNPKMKPFIFMEKNGIHIIDLKKTQEAIEVAAQKMTEIVSQGVSVLFVGTKKQAKGAIINAAKKCESNWVSERWLGGMLTNFSTIRKSVKRLQNIEKMENDGTFDKITKKERLFLSRERDKLRKILDGVENLVSLPGALFIVDIKKESIAVNEALRLNIPIFAIVDTNCDPDPIDFIIPANDDAVRAVELIVNVMADAINEGLVKAKELRAAEASEREKNKKENEVEDNNDKSQKVKVRHVKFDGKRKRGPREKSEQNESKEQPSSDSAPKAEEPKVDNASSEEKKEVE